MTNNKLYLNGIILLKIKQNKNWYSEFIKKMKGHYGHLSKENT